MRVDHTNCAIQEKPDEPCIAGLVFITHVGPPDVKNKAIQTQIRKHVMRDIGKSRRKVKKNAQVDLEVRGNVDNEDPLLGHRSKSSLTPDQAHKPHLILIDRPSAHRTQQLALNEAALQQQAWQRQEKGRSRRLRTTGAFDRLWTGRADPFLKYPFDLDQRTRELVDQAFDGRYVNIGPFRDACLPVGMTDEAAFLQILSNALVNVSCGRAENHDYHTEPLEAMLYHAKAVKLVNDRIGDPEYLKSDGFIGAVIGFACYHSCTAAAASKGSDNFRKIHMNGIDQVLLIRGGLDTLNSNVHIRTLLGWSDVEGACIEDVQPRYPLPHFLPPPESMPAAPEITAQVFDILSIWSERFPSQLKITSLLLDLRRFSTFLQNEAVRTRREVFSNGEFGTSYLLPLMHRLCRLAEPVDLDELKDKNDIENESESIAGAMLQVLRLALTLSLSEFRRLFGINGVVCALQSSKLRALLEHLPPTIWNGLETLHIWCLAMGGIESTGEQRDWYADQMRKAGTAVGLDSAEEVEEEIREISWYEDVHGPMFRELWEGEDEIRFVGLPDPNGKGKGGWKYGGHRPVKKKVELLWSCGGEHDI